LSQVQHRQEKTFEERLDDLEALLAEARRRLDELEERRKNRSSSTHPREDEDFEAWLNRLRNMVRAAEGKAKNSDFKVAPENLDEALGVLREALDEVKEPQIDVGNRLWHQGLSEKMEEQKRLERSIEKKIRGIQADIDVLKEMKK